MTKNSKDRKIKLSNRIKQKREQKRGQKNTRRAERQKNLLSLPERLR
jgi:hypothetical protein